MKRIKNIKQLHAEKQRLEQHQKVLEAKILGNWQELKQGINPVTIVRETYGKVLNTVLKSDSIIKGALTYGAGLLIKKIADKGSSKLASLFKK